MEESAPKRIPDAAETSPSPAPHLRAVEDAPEPAAPAKRRRKRKLVKSAYTEDFFREPKVHSLVKASITSKFFMPWARIMKPRARSGRMAYIDLYAGKGVYDDGTDSTPMLIMKSILDDEALRKMVVTYFADADPACVAALKANLAALPHIDQLKHSPQVESGAAHEHGIAEEFAQQSVVPTLLFLDPFGYHGLSQSLIRAILKDWGCDVIFFFCYARIRAAIMNRLVRDEMNEIFGAERVDALRATLPKMRNQEEKERAILAALEESLRSIGGNYVLTFRFRDGNGHVTHHLVFVTKHPTAYTIMKEIMGHESSGHSQEVPNFEYQPGAAVPLFDTDGLIDKLKDKLLERYTGKHLSVEEIFLDHNYGRPYLMRNYQEALSQLWREGKVQATRAEHRPPLNAKKRIPASGTYITFP